MRGLLAFAVAVAIFVLRHVPPLDRAEDWIGLATPFVVVGAAAALLVSLGARGPSAWVAVAAAVAYVDGHGIHLSANSIRSRGLTGEAERVAFFWDEQLSHWELHVGLVGLLVAFCLAEPLARPPLEEDRLAGATAAAVLGVTLFTSTVEGGTWLLLPPAAVTLGAWAVLRPRPLLRACAGAAVLAAFLLAAWAAWHGGVPEFSELGWI